MKKLFLIFLILSLACFGTIGCGAKEKLEEKAAEKLTEEFLEQAGAEDVDIDGDTITFKGEDGEEVKFGSGSGWPESELGKSIPEFTKGRQTSITETSNYLLITFEEVEESDAVAYIDKNKENFTVDSYESKSEEMISWAGANDEGLALTLTLQGSSFSIMLFLDDSE